MNQQTNLFSGSPFEASEPYVNKKVYIGVDPGGDGGVIVLQGKDILEKHTVPKKKVKSTKPAKWGSGPFKGKNKKENGKLVYNMVSVMYEEEYCEIIKGLRIRYPDAVVVLEKVKSIGTNPRQAAVGATQNFNFGHNFGLIRGFIIACSFKSFYMLTPQEWQKEVFHERDHRWLEPGVKDTKGTTLTAFLRVFPNVDMRKSSRASNYHDGMVDAAMIAYAAQSKNL